jgi:membrane-bound metal-dependent hydrolase YbcI (DUF457 family)
MKGIAHFASAVAVASFLPQVVERSAQGSLVLLLAGLGGLAPDTLDFRLARFLSKPDVEIGADFDGTAPEGLNAQAVADRLAAFIERAHRTGSSAYARLGTVKLGTDLWQRYSIHFEDGRVRVRVGPLVDGAQTPIDEPTIPGPSAQGQGQAVVAAPMRCEASLRRGAAVVVDVFSGTMLEFRPCKAGIEVVFLPWHRRWSHSLFVTALLGGAIALWWEPLGGLVYVLGSLTHILEDQLGHMGSNLLYPFTRRRIGGLGLFHSGDALPNLFAVWSSAVLLLLNLDRFSPAPVLQPWPLLALGLVLPWGLVGALWGWNRRGRRDGQRGGGVLDRPPAWREATVVDVSQDGERRFVQHESALAESGPGDE